ncbi:S8 family peptidase [Streptomyces sp. H39-S7]|uniref:S8 family peptidase n=1 Tax=Streptomyces sp. H39-S7 TaxID=3004357 RepID=UPI0022AEF387|nr:S8 family serine peptidase [Streptomyces sp. H39-S7]MCZ4118891.1 S8 family serine peptidase [Streptomyces sp. H39-S7]
MTPIRRRASLLASATALALSTGLLLPTTPANAAPGATPRTAAPQAKTYDITLVTGDVVHFADGAGTQDTVTVDRPHGAPGGVHVQQSGGETYVLPDEALPLLAAGKLDRRLFDLTALVKMGYDDARSGGVPMIATYTAAARAARSLPAAPAGSSTTRPLPSIGGAALKARKKETRAFWQDVVAAPAKARSLDNGIDKLWLDGRVEASLKESVPQVNAPQAWAKGYDGKGRKVAILDTGIDDTHPDLKDQVSAEQSFVPGQAVTDGNGHGTHVASTIAGTGAASDGDYKGVAAGAKLLIGKVLSNEGSGEDSWIIAGMEWAKAQGADVVSMSLGSPLPDDGSDPMSQAVDSLSANGGPLFVIAAGNAYAAGSIGSPGSAASALTVAAVDKQDGRADFSSMGPLEGSYGLKPDISAPGVDITAARSQALASGSGMYQTMSGTSMATPHVAGAAAILKQRHPDWTGQQLKDALMSSSQQLTAFTPYEMGTGRLDVLAAVDSTVQATGSVAAAAYKWPHDGAASTTRTLTYRNNGSADVTLNLALDPAAQAAGAYTLSAKTVTVPAGGTAAVTLTLDPATVPSATTFSGQVTATDAAGGKAVAHTGFALTKEQELYDYTIKLNGRDGKPATGIVVLAEKDNPYLSPLDVAGERTLRLPPGTYMAYAELEVAGDTPDSRGLAVLASPETVLTKSTTVALDASTAHRVSTRVPQETEQRQLHLDLARTFSNGNLVRDAYVVPPAFDAIYAAPTRKVTDGTFSFVTRWRLGEKQVDASAHGRDLDLMPQAGATVQDGSAKLRVVTAGKGAAADYAGLDVRGKAVVVTHSAGVSPADRAANALRAGAKLLIVVNDGTGRLSEYYADDAGVSTPLSVVSTMRDAGARLVADARGGKLTLDVTQRTYPRYLYDLLSQQDGTIPDRPLAYTPDPKRDLARIDAVYNGDRQRAGGGFRYNIPAWGPGVGFAEKESYPGKRTEYVSQQHGAGFWYEDHAVYQPDYSDVMFEMRGGNDHFTAGRHYTTSWFGGVQRPRLGQAFWGPNRSVYNDIQFNLTPWTDAGAGHSGSMPSDEYDTTTYAVYQGDKLLDEGAGRAGLVTASPGTAPYRFVLDSTRDAATWKSSIRTHTEWGFVSGPLPTDGPFQEDIKLLQLDYDVPTDTAGDVRAGQWTRIGVSSRTQEWLNGVTKATRATLSVSYDDGKTWAPTLLVRTGEGSWSTLVRTPDKPGGSVSLKATAQDGKGGTISQEIIRAFGLR